MVNARWWLRWWCGRESVGSCGVNDVSRWIVEQKQERGEALLSAFGFCRARASSVAVRSSSVHATEREKGEQVSNSFLSLDYFGCTCYSKSPAAFLTHAFPFACSQVSTRRLSLPLLSLLPPPRFVPRTPCHTTQTSPTPSHTSTH